MKNTAPALQTIIKRAAAIQTVRGNLLAITREFELIIGVGGGVNVHVQRIV